MRDLTRIRFNMTSIRTKGNVITKKFESPGGRFVQIEVYTFITVLLLIFLAVSGSFRRRLRSGMLTVVSWIAFTLSTYLITYTLGLMQEVSSHAPLFPVWGTILVILFGSADSFSAYSLNDNEQWLSFAAQIMVKIFLFALLWLSYTDTFSAFRAVGAPSFSFFFVFLFPYLVVLLRFGAKVWSLQGGCLSVLQIIVKPLADYMITEHQLCGPVESPDLMSMKGYKYLVVWDRMGCNFKQIITPFNFFVNRQEIIAPAQAPNYRRRPEIAEGAITVEKVWECEGWLLRSDGGDPKNKFKDICLSFALYRLLQLKISAYALPKEAHEKAWTLIRKVLLSNDGYERAFRVAEVELTFLFDLFYTKYASIFHRVGLCVRVVEFLFLSVGSIMMIVFLVVPYGLNIHTIVTVLMLTMILIVEFLQIFLFVTSEWTKLSLLCGYVKKKSWQGKESIEKFIGWICSWKSGQPWERILCQYALLESYNYSGDRWLHTSLAGVLVGPCHKQSSPVMLSPEVKEVVFKSLIRQEDKLANGESSLRLNNLPDTLSWACRLETQTQVIMVWHIVTSICEYEIRQIANSPLWKSANFEVATNLSKYLAYIVASAPKLSPDHPYVARYVFHQIVLEARKAFEKCKEVGEVIGELKRIAQTNDEADETVINRGARLWKQLMSETNDEWERIWKILADFWAELVLYVAASENAQAHIEHLAMGGEFVTHLWALLCHAGRHRAQPRSPTPLPAPNDQQPTL